MSFLYTRTRVSKAIKIALEVLKLKIVGHAENGISSFPGIPEKQVFHFYQFSTALSKIKQVFRLFGLKMKSCQKRGYPLQEVNEKVRITGMMARNDQIKMMPKK